MSGLVALSAAAAVPPALPEGWIYLEREGIDTTPGAYHDSVSGVFVRSEAVGLPNVVAPWAEGKARTSKAVPQKGKLPGFDYQKVVTPASRGGCQELTVSLLPEGHPETSWNFGADVCGSQQQERAEALIFALPKLLRGWPDPNEFNRSGALVLSRVGSFAPGSAWTIIRQSMGPPEYADASGNGGFSVSYTIEGRRVTLSFGQDQRLVKMGGLRSSSNGPTK